METSYFRGRKSGGPQEGGWGGGGGGVEYLSTQGETFLSGCNSTKPTFELHCTSIRFSLKFEVEQER